MNNTLSKKFAVSALGLSLIILLGAAPTAGAYYKLNAKEQSGLNTGFKEVGIGKGDVYGTTASIINIVLGILGIVAVVIIVAGGFTWMTAAGNEDKVGSAKKMITQGVIGLVIVFAAWGIATFVINQLGQATNDTVAAPANNSAPPGGTGSCKTASSCSITTPAACPTPAAFTLGGNCPLPPT
jgi:hypothetical protein